MSLVNVVSDAVDIFDFQWPKSVAGYELQAKPKSTSQILRDSGPFIVRRGVEMRTYSPRAIPDLHRRFAAVGDSPAAVLEFVQAYGFLGVGALPRPRDIEWESVSDILAARNSMRDALAAFDDLLSLETKAKRTAKEMKEEGRKVDEARVHDFRQMAGGFFNQWASPRLVLRLRSTKHGLAVHAEPQTLLGSMWLQVAEELTGGPKYRHCEWCRKPMPIGKGGGRIDRTTCSDACRQALSTDRRKRKAEAESKTAKKSNQVKRGSK